MDTMALLQLPAMAPWRLDEPGNGKMFGVLVVVAPDGTPGYLRAFSGMMAGQWVVDGWAPPAYDAAARDAVWIPGEAELYDLGADDDARTARSRELLPAIQNTYHFANARGEVRALRDLFAPKEPPGGAGDCAAPKLLAQAYALGLRPLALAEFWWGAPPRTGDRRAGSFYPACQGKCPPILAHMLGGLPADPPPVFGAAAIAESEPRVLYEDEYLVVVDKPCGLLSVPGRSGLLRDSVSTRLRVRYPDATGQLVVHRLDLDTSGVLLIASWLVLSLAQGYYSMMLFPFLMTVVLKNSVLRNWPAWLATYGFLTLDRWLMWRLPTTGRFLEYMKITYGWSLMLIVVFCVMYFRYLDAKAEGRLEDGIDPAWMAATRRSPAPSVTPA